MWQRIFNTTKFLKELDKMTNKIPNIWQKVIKDEQTYASIEQDIRTFATSISGTVLYVYICVRGDIQIMHVISKFL